ncbi:hypothetical protein [Acidipila sp. EB88]|uniref:hypothetical protein n=1 Tax=Acidipila sp. EB88 TaxID=2305226 RepID=UPI0018F319E7|nr:hypothetical protein [Acidipila sp. EB88]
MLNWDLHDKGKHLIAFVKELTRLRHKFPILRRSRFYEGYYNEAIGVKGSHLDQRQRHRDGRRALGRLQHEVLRHAYGCRAQPTGIQKRGGDATLLLVINEHSDLVQSSSRFPSPMARRVGPADRHQPRGEWRFRQLQNRRGIRRVTARSVLLLALKSENAQSGPVLEHSTEM